MHFHFSRRIAQRDKRAARYVLVRAGLAHGARDVGDTSNVGCNSRSDIVRWPAGPPCRENSKPYVTADRVGRLRTIQ
jgi:hypothetical protein